MCFGFVIVVIFSNGGFSRVVGMIVFVDLIMCFMVNIVCMRNNVFIDFLL